MKNKVEWNREVYERDVKVEDNIDKNIFIKIEKDGKVIVYEGKSE